jgi:hypothetical protein
MTPSMAGVAGAVVTVLFLGAGGVAPEPSELDLPAVAAFALGARTQVRDVEQVDVAAFNDSLAAAQSRREAWTESFAAVAMRLAQLPPQGREQRVEVAVAPGEWEPGVPLRWARVSVEDRGWLDDSVQGVRLVAWLVPGPQGGLRVHRALRASECSRPGAWFYSVKPCP